MLAAISAATGPTMPGGDESIGEAEEAEQLLRQALEGKRKLLGESHPSTLISLNNLAAHLQHTAAVGAATKTVASAATAADSCANGADTDFYARVTGDSDSGDGRR